MFTTILTQNGCGKNLMFGHVEELFALQMLLEGHNIGVMVLLPVL